MIKDRILYFDMDGVLSNFRKRAGELGIRFKGYLFEDEKKAWDKIQRLGSNFWSELEPIEGSFELFTYACQIFKRVEVLSVGRDEASLNGKLIWCKQLQTIAQKYGTLFKPNIIFNNDKSKYSFNGETKNILIDDWEGCKWNGDLILFKNAKQAKTELVKLTNSIINGG